MPTSHMNTTTRTAARLIGAAAMVAAILTGAPAHAAPTDTTTDTATTSHPGPATAKGYARMFARTVAKGEAGAADVSLSAPLADGRVVWLFGDTFSPRNGMVHSSAIVQTGSRLHVSNHGRQALPDDRNGTAYWIEAATEVRPGILAVTAAPMHLGGANAWDFTRTRPESRVARMKVTPAGDVRFTRWTGYVTAPAPFADFDFGDNGPGHVTYEHRAHPWADLADGSTLMTHANNYDLGGPFKMKGKHIDYAAYAPTYYAGDGIERRAVAP